MISPEGVSTSTQTSGQIIVTSAEIAPNGGEKYGSPHKMLKEFRFRNYSNLPRNISQHCPSSCLVDNIKLREDRWMSPMTPSLETALRFRRQIRFGLGKTQDVAYRKEAPRKGWLC